jgi:hypothetical protein
MHHQADSELEHELKLAFGPLAQKSVRNASNSSTFLQMSSAYTILIPVFHIVVRALKGLFRISAKKKSGPFLS